MTDEEILAPGLREFACGGAINVHRLSADGDQVLYALKNPGSDEWFALRTSIDHFLKIVRKELAE